MMELEKIKTQTSWNEAAGSINRNNLKVESEIAKLSGATYKNKGYFKSSTALNAAYPTASAGSRAYVGVRYPYSIYVWENGAWVSSGETGGDESLDLTDYYTKDEVKAMFVQSDVVRNINVSYTPDQLKAMEAAGTLEEGVLYLGFEQ